MESNMQDLITSTTTQSPNIPDSGAQMSVDQQGNNNLLYTATIFAQDISNASHEQQQETKQPQSQQPQIPLLQSPSSNMAMSSNMPGQISISQQTQHQVQSHNFKSKANRYQRPFP
jgi:hypothetical protein